MNALGRRALAASAACSLLVLAAARGGGAAPEPRERQCDDLPADRELRSDEAAASGRQLPFAAAPGQSALGAQVRENGQIVGLASVQPNECLSAYGSTAFRGGRILGRIIMHQGEWPSYGLSEGDTVYVLARGLLPSAAPIRGGITLVNPNTNPSEWTRLTLTYHEESTSWGAPWARLVGTRRTGALPPRSGFRLASLGGEPAGGTAQDEVVVAWFSCLSGCCRAQSR